MKIPGQKSFPSEPSFKIQSPNPIPDLIHRRNLRKSRRRTRTPKWKKDGALRRPETPLLQWKENAKVVGMDWTCENGGRRRVVASARKLAAGLWRLRLPDVVAAGGAHRRGSRLGFQPGASHVNTTSLRHRNNRASTSETADPVQSPISVSSSRNKFTSKLEPSFQFSNPAMEGATKWDPVCLKMSDEVSRFTSYMKPLEQQVNAVSMVSVLEAELEEAQAHIDELESERRSSKKKLEHFLKKLSEERTAWRSREHEKVRTIINDIKGDLNRERKNNQRLEIFNSKLVNELTDAKLSAKRCMQEYEKERKARVLIEEVCDELAKEIAEDKEEVDALKRENMKLREEVEEERKMLQMAEVWREERVQMKLVDAKVAVEDKYSQMNKLISDMETFLKSRVAPMADIKEMREVESLFQAAASVNIQDIKEFIYEPANPDDILSVLRDVNFGELYEREIEQCASYSPVTRASKVCTASPQSNGFSKESIHRHDIEDDGSGWETVSQLEDQGSSYSPEGSNRSVNRAHRGCNTFVRKSEWEDKVDEETPITEISEVCSVPAKQTKKSSSISKLWRSCSINGDNYKIIAVEGMNGRISNGKISNGGSVHSSDGEPGSPDLSGHWNSPDSGNSRFAKGTKGCTEWSRGSGQKGSLKARLLEARMESQKIQLRQVLKQKI